MLQHLHIQNYALITHLDIDFQEGFSALTGETGAGKSIILGALALVMGSRADLKTITEGEEKCVIEADFGEYLIRRELNRNGRSRSLVNDEVVTQSELKDLANKLIDIHSQHENLLLSDDNFQLGVVDAIAQNSSLREAYSARYTAYRAAEQALRDLETLAAKTRKDQDYIAFQYQQLDDARLQDPEELEVLESEEYRLSHVEQLKSQLQLALQALDDEEHGALGGIRSARTALQDDETLHNRLESVEIELKDIIEETYRLSEHTEFDPVRLQEVQDRLDLMNTLLRKHGVQTIAELISLRDELGEQMTRIASFDEDIARCKQELQDRLSELELAAQALTASREKVRKPISERLTKDLSALGIVHAKVDIDITPAEDYSESGHDLVNFMFAANLNQSLRRVSEVASGGEIARFMLCVKALIASTNGLPTIIFDEIDTGVSGEIATQMGKIMHEMAQSRQIIAITHLPQIAAQAQTQYRVYKNDTTTRTETHIARLTEEERVSEIASMLAGKHITPAALDTAKELLKL
ncbi:MAG: DNA repair protein RecN [Paludibacteraceae bacterium]|nr:DNA repair protein RecN [Paludibacteraceae bacterium]